jgi:hypothetical protein
MFYFKVLDAWGKFPPAGLLAGNFVALGAPWECKSLGLEIARYCSIKNLGYPKTQIAVDVTFLGNQTHVALPFLLTQLGVCVPASCNDGNLLAALDMSSSPVRISAIDGSVDVSCDVKKSMSTEASVVVGVLGIFGLVGIAASAVFEFQRFNSSSSNDLPKKEKKLVYENENDVEQPLLNNNLDNNRIAEYQAERDREITNEVTQDMKKPLAVQLMEAFAATENLRKLFTVTPGNPELERLRALDGIRVLSLLWVILGHCYLLSVNNSGMQWSETFISNSLHQ